jgi:hypothetical protein
MRSDFHGRFAEEHNISVEMAGDYRLELPIRTEGGSLMLRRSICR